MSSENLHANDAALFLADREGRFPIEDHAFICRDCGCYWALRSGGIAGMTFWVGPYAIPDVEFVPVRVTPRRLRRGARL